MGYGPWQRWIARRVTRYLPTAVLVLFLIPVVAAIAVDLGWSEARNWLDGESRSHEVGVDLLEHVLVAALVAAAAYYWLFGFKRQRALKRYRRAARTEPWQLVDWAIGNPPKVRPTIAKLLADAIARSSGPAVVAVRGRAGTGRTSFIVWLVAELAEQKFIPVPVLAGRDGKLDLDLVRDAFCQSIDDVLDTEEEANAIWHRAKATRDMVVLVDGLDDEIVAAMWRDGGDELCRGLKSLRAHHIAVVLAATRELPLKNIAALREDLDLYSREEAERFIEDEIRRTSAKGLDVQGRIDQAIAAVARLPDLVGESFIAPFYLDLLLRMQENDVSVDGLPVHTDSWRAAVLERYLDAVGNGRIVSGTDFAEEEAQEARERGREAREAADAVAAALPLGPSELMVAREDLPDIEPRALADARSLNLLWIGAERVGFAADDLGAYLVARRRPDAWPLLKSLEETARAPQGSRKRLDRHLTASLIFWHLHQDPATQAAAFEDLLGELETARCSRPLAIAAAIRIAGARGAGGTDKRVEQLAGRCIDSFAGHGDDAPQPHADELLGVVRALAGWQGPPAHRLLWKLATSRNVEVEWPAAKALALAADRPEATLAAKFRRTLSRAEKRTDWDGLSHPDDDVGNRLASLAWILPALREGDGVEKQLEVVERLCLDPRMSPLRGEMSLTQGLKLALVNGKASDANVEHARRLQHETEIRFWQARIALAQARLADGWRRGNDDGTVDALKAELRTLRSREDHVLVGQAIDLARDGLSELKKSARRNKPQPALTRYMWTHERDVVRWVEQGRHRVTQLAGDVVLLSNMTYRLRRRDPPQADRVVQDPDLPPCLQDSRERARVGRGWTTNCVCGRGLCKQDESPVLASRARFSQSFCREQSRVVARHGAPSWTKRELVPGRRVRCLRDFWEGQAEAARPRWG